MVSKVDVLEVELSAGALGCPGQRGDFVSKCGIDLLLLRERIALTLGHRRFRPVLLSVSASILIHILRHLKALGYSISDFQRSPMR